MINVMSENWELISKGPFYLYRAKDNSYICIAYIERPEYPMMVARASFIRDLNLITGPLSKYSWCPTFADESKDGWKIYLKFCGHFCKDILDRNEPLEDYCPNWKEQLAQICMDFRKEQLYKITINPEYFFIDEDKNLKTFGFYNSFTYGEQPVMTELFLPTLTKEESQFIYTKSQMGRLDFKYLEEFVFNNSAWPKNVLQEIYEKMYAVNGSDSSA